jgi:UDP:flavonoid glycosyltransferase YjiC (YdhE family)
MAVGQAAPKLRAELAEQQPDLIISDVLWFGAWYERIAQWLGCPLVKNSLDGSLAYNQRPFVQIYGVSKVSPLAQLVVERAASTSRTLCSSFYRMRYFRDWLGLLSIRRKAAAKFKAAFPIDDECPPNTHCIVTGTARLERDRLATLLELKGADRREFSALMFRSRVRVPDDLWNWIRSDTSRSIVYVSFGSAVDIDAKFARTIYEALRLVDARVLWSLPAHQRALLPAGELTDENIRFESFVPQPEVLGLSAVRCFLTQGGPHSVQEALFGATPMVCIPFFADQAYNSSVIQRLHVGRRLWRRKISAESLAGTINEILHNPDYLRAAIEISEVLAKNEGGSAIAEYVRGLLTSRSRAI